MLSRSRLVAWIALAAMLFSAVSPALAAALFAERPDVLRRILALPPAAAAVFEVHLPQDDCHEPGTQDRELDAHSGHHGAAGGASHEGDEHAAHGVFCSFCLTPGATLSLPGAQAAAWALTAGQPVLREVERAASPAGRPATTRHPRDPPAVS
jgi:hypothetical protein